MYPIRLKSMNLGVIELLFIVVCCLFASVSFAQTATKKPAISVKTYIPVQAPTYLPALAKEVEQYMPEIHAPHYFGGLIEQESCYSLTHSKCWNPNAKLDTKHELGVGLGQITKAYREDGSVRMDALSDMAKRYKAELKELSWSNVQQRPDLQMRAIVLMVRESYKSLFQVQNPSERLAMADAAYNGGLGGLKKERLQCGLTKGCDPQYWFGHIEKVCLKSQKPLYGNRNACMINREHVENVLRVRMHKYEPYFTVKK